MLLPVDTAGRVLELLQILESVSREKIMASLVLIGSTTNVALSSNITIVDISSSQ